MVRRFAVAALKTPAMQKMVTLSSNPAFLLILTLIISVYDPVAIAQEDNATSDLISDLQSLRYQSPTGVVHLTDLLLQRILSLQTSRPFCFLVFFDAKNLHSHPQLSLPSLKSEFSLVSRSFLSNNPADTHPKIFFFDVEHQESQSIFDLFAVNALPNIKLVPVTAVDMKNESVQMRPGDLSNLAESMAEFVESETMITIGPISRPPIFSKKQIVIVVAIVLISASYVIKRVISWRKALPIPNKKLWMAGAVIVYFFSVSGTMYNIIRKVPMFIPDRNNPGKVIFFVQGPGMQLGAEGFAIGFLYTIVGLLLAFVTHLLPCVKSKSVQRLVMVFVLFVSFWAVMKVIHLNNWKTGYRIHAYWPSSN